MNFLLSSAAGVGDGNTPDAESGGTTPAATIAYQQARDAAAELAYPDTRHGIRVARGWPEVLVTPIKAGGAIDWSWDDGSGLCAGDRSWISDDTVKIAQAKQTCLRCPLLEPCQAHGLAHEQFNVWGALSAEDRRDIRKGRATVDEVVSRVKLRRGRPRKPIPHGTNAGAAAHWRRGEPMCDPCKAAKAAYQHDHAQRTEGRAS